MPEEVTEDGLLAGKVRIEAEDEPAGQPPELFQLQLGQRRPH